MRRFLLAAVPAVALAAASPAVAEFYCAGTTSTVVACVNTDAVEVRLEPYDDCVYLGGDTCTPVTLVQPVLVQGGGCLIYWGGEIGQELFGPCR